jgi:hypothetical protein
MDASQNKIVSAGTTNAVELLMTDLPPDAVCTFYFNVETGGPIKFGTSAADIDDCKAYAIGDVVPPLSGLAGGGGSGGGMRGIWVKQTAADDEFVVNIDSKR